MPQNDVAAAKSAAERHAFAVLIRSEGWRLYMARMLTALWTLDNREGSADATDHQRSKMAGHREHILMDIAWVYKQADEMSPLEAERKAMLERLTAIQHADLPEAQAPNTEAIAERDRQVERQLRRSRRMHAQGVE